MARSATQILGDEFLVARAKLLEVAAFFDRLEQAGGTQAEGDAAQFQLLRDAVQLLNSDQTDKAAKLQLLFSRAYDADWRQKFGL